MNSEFKKLEVTYQLCIEKETLKVSMEINHRVKMHEIIL